MDFASVLSSNHGRDIVFNLVSTYFVYGNTTVPAREETPCNPLGFYNVTAYAREQLLKTYCMMFPNVKYRIMRLGNVIGIDDPKASQKKNVLQWMIKKMARGEEVTITADVVRDYIDVRDCVRAIRLVIDKGEYNTTYNIANGKGIRLSTLVEEANRELGYRAKVNYAGTSNQGVFLPPAFYLDTTKIKKLGYIQQHDITVSVREIAQYYAKKEKQEEQEEANTKNAENTNSSNSGISENSRNT
jgi:nucleoside-diphosphate-sugar epimerase